MARPSLVEDNDVLFDESMYEDIPDARRALSYVRFYSRYVGRFRQQLLERNWTIDDVEELIGLLWKRVIAGCRKFGIPLTTEALAAEKWLKA